MINIILEILKNNKDKQEWAVILNEILPFYDINTDLRVAHFFSQTCHESNDFNSLQENLRYSAQGLLKTFPKYFPNEKIALEYQYKPERIANRVYANRMGNGNELSGDGWKYRGRGILQLTGKNNYKTFSQDVFKSDAILNNPDLVAHNRPSTIHSACWFWNVNNLNKLADKDDCIALSKRINGGTHGLRNRQARLARYKKLFI